MPDPVPASLDWKNINALWSNIEQAKKTKDPAQWEQVTGSVKAALDDWKRVVNKWPDLVKKFHIVKQHAERMTDPEKKQIALDAIQRMREQMPANIKAAVDSGKKLVPVKFETVESLLQSLEGIRQGDWQAFAGPVKTELANWYENQRSEQHQLQQMKKTLLERLHGVQDPEKRVALGERIKAISKDKQGWLRQAEMSTDPEQKKRYTQYAKNVDKEISSIERRLLGAKGEDTKAKLMVMLRELEVGIPDDSKVWPPDWAGRKIRTDDELRSNLKVKGAEAKYDALMWLVTNIAHPIKVLNTQRSMVNKPTTAPYAAPKPPELPPDEMSSDESDIELERPPKEASECRILASLIADGKLNEAKKFWIEQYGLSQGDLVVLSNGLKGRVRLIESNTMIVDLFKNDLIKESAVRTRLYDAKLYL